MLAFYWQRKFNGVSVAAWDKLNDLWGSACPFRSVTFKVVALVILLASAANAQTEDGIAGPFEKLQNFDFLFRDSRVERAKQQDYIFALSRWRGRPSFTLNKVSIEEPGIDEKMRKCYALASQAIHNLQLIPAKGVRDESLGIQLGEVGVFSIALSFRRSALQANPQLAELQSTLESLLPGSARGNIEINQKQDDGDTGSLENRIARIPDTIFGLLEKLRGLSFGFKDSRVQEAKQLPYRFDLSRGSHGDSLLTLNKVPLEGREIDEKMRKCYALASQGVHNLRIRSTKDRERSAGAQFVSFAIDCSSGSVFSLVIDKTALQENPHLAELQSALESLLSDPVQGNAEHNSRGKGGTEK